MTSNYHAVLVLSALVATGATISACGSGVISGDTPVDNPPAENPSVENPPADLATAENLPVKPEPATQSGQCGGVPPKPCAHASGLGTYVGQDCDEGHPFIITHDISCQDALSNCALNISQNPGVNLSCEWNDQFLLQGGPDTSACTKANEPCAHASGLGTYVGHYCDLGYPFIITHDISCQDALSNCALNISQNPSMNLSCEWNGQFLLQGGPDTSACTGANVP